MAITSTILMVRPAAFGFNAETAANNFFQTNPNESKEELQQKALSEFDKMVVTLRKHGVNFSQQLVEYFSQRNGNCLSNVCSK